MKHLKSIELFESYQDRPLSIGKRECQHCNGTGFIEVGPSEFTMEEFDSILKTIIKAVETSPKSVEDAMIKMGSRERNPAFKRYFINSGSVHPATPTVAKLIGLNRSELAELIKTTQEQIDRAKETLELGNKIRGFDKISDRVSQIVSQGPKVISDLKAMM